MNEQNWRNIVALGFAAEAIWLNSLLDMSFRYGPPMIPDGWGFPLSYVTICLLVVLAAAMAYLAYRGRATLWKSIVTSLGSAFLAISLCRWS